tara:strand:- start:170 stop:694 length:525 start_codon:yes stop_codon:yes gene_type:complete
MAYVPPHLRRRANKPKTTYEQQFPKLSSSNNTTTNASAMNYNDAAKVALIENEGPGVEGDLLPEGWIKLEKQHRRNKSIEGLPIFNTMEEEHMYYMNALKPLVERWENYLQEYIMLNGYHPEAYYKCEKQPIDDYEYSDSEDDEDSGSDEEMVDSDGEPYSEHDDIGDKRFMTI